MRYTISPDGKAITCHRCGLTSHHPQDVAARYCGKCRIFHDDRLSDVDHRQPPTICPWCDTELDAARGIGSDDAPKVGDLTICIGCGGICVFGIGLVPQRCPEAVWQAEPEPIPSQLRKARRAIHALHSSNRKT